MVEGKERSLRNGLLENDYHLRPESGFQVEAVSNYSLVGASIPGLVTERGAWRFRLSLESDGPGEEAESWHSHPVFYSGGGKGYGGRPELGDRLYLYFPSEKEERCVIGGGGAEYGRIESATQQLMDEEEKEGERVRRESERNEGERYGVLAIPPSPEEAEGPGVARSQASPESTPGYKSWTTPKGKGVCLHPKGVRVQDGEGEAFHLSGRGIVLKSRGMICLRERNGMEANLLEGK